MRKRRPSAVSTLMLTSCRIRPVDTPLKRMKKAMKMRGWNESQWAAAAGLKERSHVNKLLKRIAETGEVAGDMKTFVKLADAANVSLDWLLLGRGQPVPVDLAVTEDAKYPTRASVVWVGKILDLPQDVVDFVLNFDAGPSDPGADFWLQLLLGKRNELAVRKSPQSGKNT